MCGSCGNEPGTSTSHCFVKLRSSHLKRASKGRHTLKFISRKFKEARSYLLQKQCKSEIAEMDKNIKQSKEEGARLLATREQLSNENVILSRKLDDLEDIIHAMRLSYLALLASMMNSNIGVHDHFDQM